MSIFLDSSPLKLKRNEDGVIIVVDSAGKAIPSQKVTITEEVDCFTMVEMVAHVSGWADEE